MKSRLHDRKAHALFLPRPVTPAANKTAPNFGYGRPSLIVTMRTPIQDATLSQAILITVGKEYRAQLAVSSAFRLQSNGR